MSNIFPTDYTDKWSADATDKVWASDGTTNFNITVDEIGTKNFATRDTDNLSEWAINKYATTANVDSAGATMNTDTTLVWNAYFLDETGLTSNSATKVPSQQSVKAYMDSYTPADSTTTTKWVVEKATSTEVENWTLDKFPDALDIKTTYSVGNTMTSYTNSSTSTWDTAVITYTSSVLLTSKAILNAYCVAKTWTWISISPFDAPTGWWIQTSPDGTTWTTKIENYMTTPNNNAEWSTHCVYFADKWEYVRAFSSAQWNSSKSSLTFHIQTT